MFVQVIQGRAGDADALRAHRDRWERDLMPGAEGFLGSTAGVSDDGEFFAMARFESEEAARRNSDRPEQGAWWAELLTHLDGEPTVHNSTTAELFAGGGSDEAGFVQVMQGEVLDLEALEKLVPASERWLKENRPDLIGSVFAMHEDGKSYTEVAYFTSEREAREGEKRMNELDASERAWMQDYEKAQRIDRYVDLRNPWMVTR